MKYKFPVILLVVSGLTACLIYFSSEEKINDVYTKNEMKVSVDRHNTESNQKVENTSMQADFSYESPGNKIVLEGEKTATGGEFERSNSKDKNISIGEYIKLDDTITLGGTSASGEEIHVGEFIDAESGMIYQDSSENKILNVGEYIELEGSNVPGRKTSDNEVVNIGDFIDIEDNYGLQANTGENTNEIYVGEFKPVKQQVHQ